MTGIRDLEITLAEKENVKLNKKIQQFVDNLSSKKQSVDYYVSHRNVKAEKAMADIFLGKKAEYFTSLALKKYYNIEYLEPDLEIRKGRKKGWDCDLPYSNFNLHVKSCNAKTVKFCKDYSWTFQLSNNNGFNGKDKLLSEEKNDLISLVYIDNHLSNTGVIKAILPWDLVGSKLKDPIKPTLIGLKKCLYYKDLC